MKRIPRVDNVFQIWLLGVGINEFFVLKPVETIQNALKIPREHLLASDTKKIDWVFKTTGNVSVWAAQKSP